MRKYLQEIETRFLSNSPAQKRPPDSSPSPSADSASHHYRGHHSLVCIYCYHSRHRQNLISVVVSIVRNGAFMESGVDRHRVLWVCGLCWETWLA